MVLTETKAISMWMDHLAGELDEKQQTELLQFLSDHPALQKELKMDEVLWSELAKIKTPDPSENMDKRFQGMLYGYIAANERNSAINWWPVLQEWVSRSWHVGIASLIIGLAIGWIVLPTGSQKSEIKTLSREMKEIKKMMMLTLIEQPQAQERIRAVSLVHDFKNADTRVVEVLAKTLNEDRNINVRLAALESLAQYWDSPNARTVLVNAISKQDSPLVQVAIADVMLALREKSSIVEFNKLLAQPELNEGVKMKIESTVQKLIEI